MGDLKVKITIAGTGYVGLSNAILLAQHNEVIALDIIQEKVDMINDKISPIDDVEIKEYLSNKELNLIATTDAYKAYSDAEFVIISTPTNYDIEKNYMEMQQSDVLKTYADVSDLEKDIDFKPSTSIEEGLGKFVDWYKIFYKI